MGGIVDSRSLTAEEKKIARNFCDFVYEVPVTMTFTLWNLQGALRAVNPGVPEAQTYADHLRFAAKEGWIKEVSGEPGNTCEPDTTPISVVTGRQPCAPNCRC